ncbi:hypothetical protein MTO96_043825 [Rhipicephalus appendiculatus]
MLAARVLKMLSSTKECARRLPPDSASPVDYDRADAIGNGEVRVDAHLPDSTRGVDSGRVRLDADVIDASEVCEARACETATLEGLSSVSGTARKIERFTDANGAATAPACDEPPPYLIVNMECMNSLLRHMRCETCHGPA